MRIGVGVVLLLYLNNHSMQKRSCVLQLIVVDSLTKILKIHMVFLFTVPSASSSKNAADKRSRKSFRCSPRASQLRSNGVCLRKPTLQRNDNMVYHSIYARILKSSLARNVTEITN